MNLNTRNIKAELITTGHKQIIEQVLTENKSILELLSNDVSIEQDVLAYLNYSDLPANASSARLRTYVLLEPDTNDPLGVLSVLLGYPSSSSVYIGNLFLRPHKQRKGLGQEIVIRIHEQIISQGFKESKVLIGLKNWPALRFWTKLGYTTITDFKGDSTYGKDQYCSVELNQIHT